MKGSYKIDANTLKNVMKEMLILHQLPRVNGINADMDLPTHARYFQQVGNGTVIRMALLALIFGAIS